MSKRNKNKLALTGGHAVGEAIRQIDPDVMAVYPITPQTPIVEYFAKKVADGEADTEIIPVESEHSAMSACIGSAASGARTITASSSQGIMYMLETLPIASSMRLPILMAVSNRAVSGPINIHGDHSDAMMMRDAGWVQIFSETAQEAYDNTIIALRVAEQAMLPTAINMDGFVTSHSVENLEILEDAKAKSFIGQYVPRESLFDFENPKTFGPVALPNSYFEFRKQIYDAMEQVHEIFTQTAIDFGKLSGRRYDPVEQYLTQDADKVIVAIGSTAGTVKEVVDRLRDEGHKVALLKVRLFRPFPSEIVRKALEGIDDVVVMDKNLSFGTQQVLASEIEHAIGRPVQSVVYGLGGRDIFEKQIEDIFYGKMKSKFIL